MHRRRLSLQLGCMDAHLSSILFIKGRNFFASCLIPLISSRREVGSAFNGEHLLPGK